MKKKLLGLAMALVMVLGLNVAAFGTGGGIPLPPSPWSPPQCADLDCNCQH